ncbi:MAG: DNA repair protein RadC [Rickettsiales bacterium]|jgi:DNA repair protein RadC|nr:DNA repair protein RadC [Rickettsiales bacterium]
MAKFVNNKPINNGKGFDGENNGKERKVNKKIDSNISSVVHTIKSCHNINTNKAMHHSPRGGTLNINNSQTTFIEANTFPKPETASSKIIFNQQNLNEGHRERLRNKFLVSKGSLLDYELVEMLLFSVFARKDTKELAKTLMNKFGNICGVINADEMQLLNIKGIGEGTILILKLAQEIHMRMLKDEMRRKNNSIRLDSVSIISKYCKSRIGALVREQLLVLFINNDGILVADKILNMGDANEVKIYKNVIVSEATQNGATSIVVAHNHPSGNCKPSNGDIHSTEDLRSFLFQTNIDLLDHVIATKNKVFSFAENGML